MPKMMVDLDPDEDRYVKEIQFILDTEKDTKKSKPEILTDLLDNLKETSDAREIVEKTWGENDD